LSTTRRGPLEGVTILDLSCVLSGPFGTSWLSDMGATVIKVENPTTGGDYTRQAGPFVDGHSTYYATVNRNKKCVTLNLKEPKGKEMFFELVKKADVVTENFKPGVMDKLGIGYEALRNVKKSIVLASISGYGQTGPYRNRPGYDVVAQAMGGMMSFTGFPGNPPTKCGSSVGDVAAGMNLVIGVLAALYSAKMTGEGQWVEVSLVDAMLALTTQDYIDYGHTKNLPVQLGNDYSLWCPYGTYKAKDRYFTIGIGTEGHWLKFCKYILGKEELATDERYNSQAKRVANRAEVDALVNGWCSQISAKEVVDKLNEIVIPAAMVYNYADIEADENFTVHREMIKHMDHPDIGDVMYINMPVRFNGTKLVEPTPAGRLGQYNEEVYGQYLGLSHEEIEELKAKGVI